MEKRRVRMVIGGVPVTLWTDETNEYMLRLAEEVERQMAEAGAMNSPAERPAVMAALVLCDRAVRAEDEADRLRRKLAACEEELRAEANRAEIMRASLVRLEEQGVRSRSRRRSEFAVHRNPFKTIDMAEQQGLQSFFEVQEDEDDGK